MLIASARIATAGLLALCCALGAGCAPKEESRKGESLEMVDVHFYRHSDDKTVFRVSKTTYCLVHDPAQMDAFGGFDKVEVVPPSVDFKRGKNPMAPLQCPSP